MMGSRNDGDKLERIALIVGVVAALIVFAGIALFTEEAKAADFEPFAQLEVSHIFEGATSEWLREGCNTFGSSHYKKSTTLCNGKTPSAIEFGVEIGFGDWRNDPWWYPTLVLGYRHASWLRTGAPFNNKPESNDERVFVRLKWGGLR